MTLGKRLGYITIVMRKWEDFILAAAGMSAARRARRKMAQMFVVRCNINPSPSPLPFFFENRLRIGKLCHQDIDIVEALPPPVSERHKETESNDVGLHPRKARRTVFVARILGGIGVILGNQFSGQKEVVVVPNSLNESPSPFFGSSLVNPSSGSIIGGALCSPGGSFWREKPSLVNETRTSSHTLSFMTYTLGWAITRDSLLLEDATAEE
ncbi:unnamed protein product [Lactuca saligna]|uniref:Uncharacterized protein n=1 Tax=Lactuca saligna TaxID=75948 RepID=A0AA35UVK9_LACSI|nr:unnamed protein product [Lactuca saligna]